MTLETNDGNGPLSQVPAYTTERNAQILIPAMLKLIQEQNERIKKLEGEA